MTHIAKLAALLAVLCAGGCRGPWYVHTENHYSLGAIHNRTNQPEVANDNAGIVGVKK